LIKRIAALALGICSVCGGVAAFAADNARNQNGDTLDEVIVTAQKREELSVDVPASVTAMNAETLARTGAVRLEDYAAQVPGMSLTTLSRGYTSVVLRGISTGISQPTPTVTYYIDDAPIGSITAYGVGTTLAPDLDPAGLRRIEVLKGPQGTMYGASAVGGLVRYVTNAPDPSAFHGSVTVGGNSISDGANGWNARAMVNVPVNTTSAFQFSAFSRKEGGYIDNPARGLKDVNDARTTGGRIAFGWQPNADWSVLAWAMIQRFRGGGIGSEDLNMPTFAPVTKELERRTFIPEKQELNLDAYNVTVKGKIGGAALVSSTTYQKNFASTTVDQSSLIGALFALPPPFGLGIPGIGAQTTQWVNTRRVSEEVRVEASAAADRLKYQVGLFATDENSSNQLPPLDLFLTANNAPFPVGLPLANALINIKYREYSLFANGSYSITPQLELQGGLRYSQYTQDYLQDYKRALLTAIPVFITQNEKQNKPTYLASLRYKPNANTAVYARIANGYRVGGPSALPPGVIPGGKQSYDPDSVTSYELGLKSTFLEGRASIEAAIFKTDWKDVQIQTSAQTAAGTFQYFVNGSKAESQGAEVLLLWLPVHGLTLRLTGGYTDSKLTADAPAAGGLKGDRMPFVPKFSYSAGIDYQPAPIGEARPFVGLTYSHVDTRRSNFSNKTPFDVPGYGLVNFDAGLDYSKLRASFYVKNLSNSRGINFMNGVGLAFPGVNPLGNPFTAGVVAPRTIGVDLSLRF
jgi:outer membrane receptor protein involved in Fe transport